MLNSPYIGPFFAVTMTDFSEYRVETLERGIKKVKWEQPKDHYSVTHIGSGTCVIKCAQFKTHATEIAKMLDKVGNARMWPNIYDSKSTLVAANCPKPLRETLKTLRQQIIFASKAADIPIKEMMENVYQELRNNAGATTGEQIGMF